MVKRPHVSSQRVIRLVSHLVVFHLSAFDADRSHTGCCSAHGIVQPARTGVVDLRKNFVPIAARSATELATASLYFKGDAWINEFALANARGRILSISYIVLARRSVARQVFIILFSSNLSEAFAMMSVLYSIAIIVVLPTSTSLLGTSDVGFVCVFVVQTIFRFG